MRKFALILIIAVAMPRVLFADDVSSVRLLVGRSTIVDVGSAISRVSLTSAEVADAVVTSANQLLLRVRFAEVSRTAVTDLGTSLFTGPHGYKDVLARSTTSTIAPVFDNSDPIHEKLVFSDFLNLFLFDAKHQLGTVIKALQTK